MQDYLGLASSPVHFLIVNVGTFLAHTKPPYNKFKLGQRKIALKFRCQQLVALVDIAIQETLAKHMIRTQQFLLVVERT